MNAVADFGLCEKVPAAVSFLDRLVMNYDLDRFKAFITAKRAAAKG